MHFQRRLDGQVGLEELFRTRDTRSRIAVPRLGSKSGALRPRFCRMRTQLTIGTSAQLNPSPPPEIDAYPPVRLLDYKKYGYVYTPYQCKIPHRTAFEWLDEVKLDSILVIGDAITRDYFCLNWGVLDQDVCRYPNPLIDTELDYREGYVALVTFRLCALHLTLSHWSLSSRRDKRTSYTRADGGSTRLYFHWNPDAWGGGLSNFLRTLPNPPSHVFFADTLWITRRNYTVEHYVETVKPFLKDLTRLLPKANIVTRTSTSAVQPLVSFSRPSTSSVAPTLKLLLLDVLQGCWELANITRPVLEPVNAAYLESGSHSALRCSLVSH